MKKGENRKEGGESGFRLPQWSEHVRGGGEPGVALLVVLVAGKAQRGGKRPEKTIERTERETREMVKGLSQARGRGKWTATRAFFET